MGKFSNQSNSVKPSSSSSNQPPWLLIGVGVVVILIVAGFFLFNKPTYPDITSPRPIAGNPNATIIVEEFSDFECPACRAAQAYVKPILAEFKDQIRFEYKHYPLNASCNNGVGQTVHYNACEASYASECANDQNQFWEFSDWMFANQSSLTNGGLKAGARSIGIADAAAFDACLDSQAKRSIITMDTDEGNRKAVNSTPTFYVNGDKVSDYTKLRAFILSKLGSN